MLWILSGGLPEGFGCGRVIRTTLVRDGLESSMMVLSESSMIVYFHSVNVSE